VWSRLLDLAGPVLCVGAGLFLIAGLAVDLDSGAARVLIAIGGIMFLPGAFLTLVFVRRYYGPGP
jgi:hypothetical protein